MNPRCQTCVYAVPNIQRGPVALHDGAVPDMGLLCRHDPPRVLLVPSGQGVAFASVWPQVNASDFCSRHKSEFKLAL